MAVSMNSQTVSRLIAGPAGQIACAIDGPPGSLRGVAVICHPNPQQGGTMDNKVVQTLARGFMQLGYRAVRFNFRGVGESGGEWDDGIGEVDDALAVIEALRDPGLPLAVAGFSFGAFVASEATSRLHEGKKAERLVLVGPATQRFTVAQVPDNTIVIHGEVDDVVPLRSTFDWARPQGLPVIVMPGVGHFFHGQLPRLKSLLVQNWHPPLDQ